jgi:uncharacterized protein YecE (DUF72 family)
MRHAVEVRHASFVNEEFLDLLEEYNIAIVIADTAGRWPLIQKRTADFTYLRLHGEKELYASGYTESALEDWRKKIRRWSSGTDCYVYFDNDAKVHAPFDAHALAEKLGLPSRDWEVAGLGRMPGKGNRNRPKLGAALEFLDEE